MNFTLFLFVILALSSLHHAVSSPVALSLGLCFGFFLKHPFPTLNKKAFPWLLAFSIVGIGFGIHLDVLAEVGIRGMGITFWSILFSLLFGLFLGKQFKVPSSISSLISVGTAICGGSAIAAVAATLRSRSEDISIALAVVFLLNSLALFLFPPIGLFLGLDSTQFGLWSALAIHDTSSVVGATLKYSSEALEVGTTVKLTRALWIIPVTFVFAFSARSSGQPLLKTVIQVLKKMWFIFGFILASALVTFLPSWQPTGDFIAEGGKRLFVLTLFAIGSSFNRESLKKISPSPLYQAILLWIGVAGTSLLLVTKGIVHL